ncbi:MAG: hypothetical protein VYE68_09020 [Acidobacteriota bacterium]|nr:hypothetical protein [Acidobacteriota bacterium]
MGVFIDEALTERVGRGRRVSLPLLLAILATTLVGAIDAGIQALVSSRAFDPLDMLCAVLAAVVAVAVNGGLLWARRFAVL